VKQGTGRTVLVSDLFVSEGPYQQAARDFAAGVCSGCGVIVSEQDAHFHDNGYLCPGCWQSAAGIAR
jgi:formylmethanofuran dehydrogenase subunit E